eukprot:XP_016657356.1 PREDICTED: uncharacterized protein LOC103308383 [Acyrthosiphon pisum]
MVARFRTIDLQTLLRAFGRSTAGRKSELKDRALELLRAILPGFNHAEYVSKIHEIYCSMLTDMPNNNAIMSHSLLQTQQRQMMGQIQIPQQRMYEPAPQYPQQPMHMTQVGLPTTVYVPNSKRHLYYQPSGPRSITSSHLSSSQQMNVVSQDPLGYDMQGMTFKKLPFYEVIDVVLKATFLAGTDKCTKESLFKLFVSREAINIVAGSRDVSPGKQDYSYQFQTRISHLVEPMSNEVIDFMPLGLRSSEETKIYIIKKIADVDPDLATTSYRFSLVCPLGKIRMKIPAKSIHCDNLQCFDASTFILMK